jgi:hypothetical protein
MSVNPQILNYYTHNIRNINKYTIEDFVIRISYESWDSIFTHNNNMNVDLLFNTSFNNYLRIFYKSSLQKSNGESLQKPLDYTRYKDFL